jgi:hypothetical protein
MLIEASGTLSENSDKEWTALRSLEGKVIHNHLLPYVMQELGEYCLKFAAAEFFPEDLQDSIEIEMFIDNFLIPWVLFDWIPLDDFGLENFNPKISLAQNYLLLNGDRLNKSEQLFIEKMNQTHHSFYAILEVTLHKSILVKDIMLSTTHLVKENIGTEQLKRGDILFGRLLTFENQSIFVGMAPMILPTDCYIDLLDFKKWLTEENDNISLTPEVLGKEFDTVMREEFFDIVGRVNNRPSPTLVNTDNELIQFTTTYFELSLPVEQTLEQLVPLTMRKNPDEILKNAKRTKSGKITKIEFPWLRKGNNTHKDWDNTIMGHITIKQNKLILETNSEKRAQKGKKLLSKYLGRAITFEKSIIESIDQKMKSLPNNESQNSSQVTKELMNQPEVQEQLQLMAKAHWEEWFDQNIPALNNQSPRQAAKTSDGRERLEALLLQYERHDQKVGDHPLKADIQYLKSQLELE